MPAGSSSTVSPTRWDNIGGHARSTLPRPPPSPRSIISRWCGRASWGSRSAATCRRSRWSSARRSWLHPVCSCSGARATLGRLSCPRPSERPNLTPGLLSFLHCNDAAFCQRVAKARTNLHTVRCQFVQIGTHVASHRSATPSHNLCDYLPPTLCCACPSASNCGNFHDGVEGGNILSHDGRGREHHSARGGGKKRDLPVGGL